MKNEDSAQLVDMNVAILVPLALASLWQLLVGWGMVSAYAFSSPSDIALTLLARLASVDFWSDVAISIGRLGIGCTLGVAAGIGLAFLVYLNRFARSALAPTLRFAASFPPMVWAPLVIASLGTGEVSKIVFISVATVFVQFAATYRGLVSIDGRLLEALSAFPRPIEVRIRKIYWPGSLPHVLDGLKTSVTFGWIALLFAEMIGSENGLGWLLWDSRTFGRSSDMMVALLTIGILGKLSLDLIDRLAKRWSPWYGQYGLMTSGGALGAETHPGRRRV